MKAEAIAGLETHNGGQKSDYIAGLETHNGGKEERGRIARQLF